MLVSLLVHLTPFFDDEMVESVILRMHVWAGSNGQHPCS